MKFGVKIIDYKGRISNKSLLTTSKVLSLSLWESISKVTTLVTAEQPSKPFEDHSSNTS